MVTARESTENLTVPGLEECLCGCGRMVEKGRNRNGIEKRFYDDKCRTDWDRQARQAGRRVIESGIRPEDIIIEDRRLRKLRRARQEYVDLDRMRPRERLREFCRAAKRMPL